MNYMPIFPGINTRSSVSRAMQCLSRSEGLPGEERFDRMFSWFHENYRDMYQVLRKQDGRLDHYIPLETFLKWMDTQPEGFFAEIEFKEGGLIEETDRLIRSTNTAHRCILFSGIESCNRKFRSFIERTPNRGSAPPAPTFVSSMNPSFPFWRNGSL